MSAYDGVRDAMEIALEDRAYDPYGCGANAWYAIGAGADMAGYGALVPSSFFQPSALGVRRGEDVLADVVADALDHAPLQVAHDVLTYWVRVLEKYHALIVQAGRDY